MLSQARLQTLVLTSDIERAGKFYRDILNLELKDRSHGALVFDVGGSDLRVSPVPSTSPTEHTVLGFAVDDLDQIITELASRGMLFERFASFPHDEHGAVRTPDGSRVIWFRDPDGNLLSVVQYAAATSQADPWSPQ